MGLYNVEPYIETGVNKTKLLYYYNFNHSN